MSDGAYTPGIPVWANTKSSDIEEIKENFEYIQRQWFMANLCPMNGTTFTYNWDAVNSRYSGITVTGVGITPDPTCTFTYDGSGNLTQEVWVIRGKTVTVTHTYGSGRLNSSSVTVA